MLSKFPKILLIIVIALVFSIVVTFVLQYTESTQIEELTSTTTITISNETTFGSPSNAFVKKGYFDSVGEVYVYMSSPYANYWNTFNVWMSLDNSSWTIVPFLESTTDNRTQMANLGLINLGNPQLTIYQKCYIPPQTILLPPNVTKQDASNIKSNVLIKKQATPADTTQWILVFFAVFGFIGFFLGLLFSAKYSNSTAQNVGKRRKKKSRVKTRLESSSRNIQLIYFLSTLSFIETRHVFEISYRKVCCLCGLCYSLSWRELLVPFPFLIHDSFLIAIS